MPSTMKQAGKDGGNNDGDGAVESGPDDAIDVECLQQG
jgi:hypothetical protein